MLALNCASGTKRDVNRRADGARSPRCRSHDAWHRAAFAELERIVLSQGRSCHDQTQPAIDRAAALDTIPRRRCYPSIEPREERALCSAMVIETTRMKWGSSWRNRQGEKQAKVNDADQKLHAICVSRTAALTLPAAKQQSEPTDARTRPLVWHPCRSPLLSQRGNSCTFCTLAPIPAAEAPSSASSFSCGKV